MQYKASIQLICDFIFYIYTLHLPHARGYSYSFTPHASFSLCLCHYTNTHTWHKHAYTDTQQTHKTHTLWEGLSNGFWRFQFPLCHQRQKTLWAQLPLSHTPDETACTHTRTLGRIFTCNHRHAHTSMHTLSHCDAPRITQSESRKQTERSISLR